MALNGPVAAPRGRHTVAPLMTMQVVADRLCVSTKTVRRLIEQDRLVALRVGRSLRVSEDDLRAYLSNCR